MKLLAILFGVVMCFLGACNGLQALVEPRHTRALGGATIGLFFLVVGVLFIAVGARSRRTDEDASRTLVCPHCSERIMPTAKVCRFCQRELPPIVGS